MRLEHSINYKMLSVSLLAAAALLPAAAQAADLPSRGPAVAYSAPPVFSWTGFYAGLSVGGGFAQANAFRSYLGPSNPGRLAGIEAGGQAGYNYQVAPNFVVGVENDIMFTSLKSNTRYGSISNVGVLFFGTGRGRAGFTTFDSKLFVYGTAGLAVAQVNDTGVDRLRVGWTAGGGMEWAFRPNWSAKAEYLYTDLYKDLKSANLPDRREKFHTIRVGLNYHFNLFEPAHMRDPF